MTDQMREAFQQYRRKQIAELRPYVLGEDMLDISVSREDVLAGSPKAGDMIARNPKNHSDLWLVAAAYFADNFEALTAPSPGEAQPVAGPTCRCHDDVSRKYCLDKGRCTPIAEAQSNTSPPPAPGWGEALQKRLDTLRLKALETNSESARAMYFEALSLAFQRGELVPLRREAPASSGVAEAGIDAAAEYLVRTVKRTLWDSLRKEGRARDGEFEPFPHNPRQEDYRDVVREIVRLAAPSRPDAEGDVREALAQRDIGILLANIRFLEDTLGETLEGEDASMVRQIEREHKNRAALSKPTDASNASAEARLREALRAASNVRLGDPDTTIHSMPLMPLKVYSYDQIIEFANRRIHAALSAVGGEVTKSEGLLTGDLANDVSRAAQQVADWSDPTADVKCESCFGTGRHLGRFSMNDPDCTDCNGTGLLDAFTVGRR